MTRQSAELERVPSLTSKLAAETVGTFCLVFVGTGTIVTNQMAGGSVTHVGVAMAFGLIVMVMIHTFGDVSGAHLNPAVTTGFWLAGRLPGRLVGPYALAQLVGAVLASAVLRLLFPSSEGLGRTVPAGPIYQSFVLEVLITFILMLVILAVSRGPKEKGLLASIAIGGVVGIAALFAGPICGASMNPARSLAPALVSGRIGEVWLYLMAPTIGAAAAVPVIRAIFGRSRD